MWFTASLLFKAVESSDKGDECIWEERIVLIEALNELEAKAGAEMLGRREEHEYGVASTHVGTVEWKFVQIERIYRVEDQVLRSGAQLFSRFLRQAEVEALLTPFPDDDSL